jgi:hypothetical protein
MSHVASKKFSTDRLFQPKVEEFAMHASNDSEYDPQGYDFPTLPYIPYALSPLEQQPAESPSDAPNDSSDVSYGEVPLSFTETSPFVPSEQESDQISTEPIPALPLAPRKRRLRLWVLLGVVVVVLLLSSAATFAVVSYINRSTPTKTLDAFCNAVQREDYHTAYSQFSKQLQSKLNETVFADVLSQDKIVSCTHGTAAESGTSTTTSLKLVHTSQGVNNDLVTLTKQTNSEWKIDDLQRA